MIKVVIINLPIWCTPQAESDREKNRDEKNISRFFSPSDSACGALEACAGQSCVPSSSLRKVKSFACVLDFVEYSEIQRLHYSGSHANSTRGLPQLNCSYVNHSNAVSLALNFAIFSCNFQCFFISTLLLSALHLYRTLQVKYRSVKARNVLYSCVRSAGAADGEGAWERNKRAKRL